MKAPKLTSQRWLIRGGVALIVAAGAVAYSHWRKPPADPDVILASGSIEADEAVIAPKVAGKLARLLVDEGSNVRRGDLLASLDDSELRAQLGQSEAALAAAQAKLDEAVAGNRPQQIQQAQAQLEAAQSAAAGNAANFATTARNLRKVTDLRANLDTAISRLGVDEAAYRQAVEALRLLGAGSRPDQIEEAKAALDQAKVQEAKARTDLGRNEMLIREGAISMQQYDNVKAACDAATKQTQQAEARLRDLVAGARPQELREAEQQVEQAKATLDGARTAVADAQEVYRDRLTAQQQYDSTYSGFQVAQAQVRSAQANLDLIRSGSRVEDVRSLKAARDQARKTADYARELVQDAKLYAPSDGVVKTKSALPGETLSPGTPVVTLADLDHVWIRVYVPEDRYGKLNLGQRVDVTADSFPSETFHGRIVAISSDAEFTPKNAQTPEERVKLVFGVKISLDNPERKLKPGMPGDAAIRVR